MSHNHPPIPMKCTVETINPSKKVLRIELPKEEVARAYDKTLEDVRRETALPGFRKGKVPRDVIERRFHKEIAQDTLQHLISHTVMHALEEQGIEPIADPRLMREPTHALFESEAKRREAGMSFEVEVEVYPEITLRDYKGLALAKKKTDVSSEDVEKALEDLRVRAATLVPVEGRAAREGDFVVAEVQGTLDGKPRPKDSVTLALDADLHPDFRAALVGASAGEVKEFSVRYPDDHPDKAAAGKTMAYHVEVKAVKERRLPPLDDDFAKQISADVFTLADLREQLRKDMQAHRERESRKEMAEQALAQLVARNPVDLPDAFVERQMDAQVEQAAEELMMRGMDPRKAGVDWGRVRETGRDNAKARVHAMLLLAKLAEVEKLDVSDADFSAEFARMAAALKATPEQVRAHYAKDEQAMANLRVRLRREKAIDFLLSHAKITFTD